MIEHIDTPVEKCVWSLSTSELLLESESIALSTHLSMAAKLLFRSKPKEVPILKRMIRYAMTDVWKPNL
jgi:hypothetical protein